MPAVDGEHVRLEQAAIGEHGRGHLEREFTRGREHERLRLAVRFVVLEDGEGEGGGLAGAGLRLADHVRAGEHDRDHGGLDGGRLGVPKRSDGLHEFLAQV